ncbi:MAG: FAD-dependent oxidoreductase [Candidatus Omnitrophica bacterium]|nr:FAD-dependent oxidoreductase [Candidatus Omnitrophota bacterium]MDD5670395.1 FAD-dependent oxidoreductase [Candidatus Omnitrophota bacterium]
MKKDHKQKNVILGAGMTGLTIAMSTGYPVYEANSRPGGICYSYRVDARTHKILQNRSKLQEAYHFHFAGGKWVGNIDAKVLKFIRQFVSPQKYVRRSGVYFPRKNLVVPYPIQNNLRCLDKAVTAKALQEISEKRGEGDGTLSSWLMAHFGPTLCELFFYPFHNLYTAGLYDKIVPQDAHKSPISPGLMVRGAHTATPLVGYNTTFIYPKEGLTAWVNRIAEKVNINYGRWVQKIDLARKEIHFTDKSVVTYQKIISTIPLNQMVSLTNLKVDEPPDPYTSALVLNIAAGRGDNLPDAHWLYIPHSTAGFYRVGCYSNVDKIFLPKSMRKSDQHVMLYVEKAYLGGEKPSPAQIRAYIRQATDELRSWGFIKSIEFVDPNWIDTAYAWSWKKSNWKEKAIQILKDNHIQQAGRYGRWGKAQIIADCIREGLRFRGPSKRCVKGQP